MSTNPRQALNQRVLIGIQTAVNTPIHATKQLPMSVIDFSPQAEYAVSIAAGKRISTQVNLTKEWSNITVGGKCDYNDLAYWGSSMFDYAAPTGSNEFTWVMDSNMTCKDESKLMSIWKGSCVRGDYLHDAQVQSMSLTFGNGGIDKNISMIGKEVEHGVTQLELEITGTPTGGTFIITYNSHETSALTFDDTASDIQAALIALDDFSTGDVECWGGPMTSAVVYILIKKNDFITASSFTTSDSLTAGTDPASAISAPTETRVAVEEIVRGQVSIYFADTQATLGAATAAVRNLSATFNYNNKVNPLFVLNADYSDSYKEAVETAADIGLSFSVAADSEGEAYFETMRDGDTKFMRIEAVGPVIGADGGGTSALTYKFTGDFAFQINAAPSFEDMDGLYANTWGGVIVDDATWGKGYCITLVNALSAL